MAFRKKYIYTKKKTTFNVATRIRNRPRRSGQGKCFIQRKRSQSSDLSKLTQLVIHFIIFFPSIFFFLSFYPFPFFFVLLKFAQLFVFFFILFCFLFCNIRTELTRSTKSINNKAWWLPAAPIPVHSALDSGFRYHISTR